MEKERLFERTATFHRITYQHSLPRHKGVDNSSGSGIHKEESDNGEFKCACRVTVVLSLYSDWFYKCQLGFTESASLCLFTLPGSIGAYCSLLWGEVDSALKSVEQDANHLHAANARGAAGLL